MSFYGLHPSLRPAVGPEASPELLDQALRWCGGIGPRGEPGAHAFEGKTQAPEHFCQLDAEAYDFCATASPAGGVALCQVCGIPIFVPPETCIERIRPVDVEVVIDLADRRAS